MAALQPAQFRQLQMFMKPSEIKAQPNFEFGDAYYHDGDDAALRAEKLRESDDPKGERWRAEGGKSLTQRIESEGVREPVTMVQGYRGRTLLDEGHHRFFVQERREQRGEEVYLPVKHWSV